MTGPPATQLPRLLAQLERGERTSSEEETAQVCRELVEAAQKQPADAPEGDQDISARLERQLFRFADAQQQAIVAAYRPLLEQVRRGVIESTAALNKKLSDFDDRNEKGAEQVLALLKRIDGSFWFSFYKQCTDVRVKAEFLCAAAGCVRALQGGGDARLPERVAAVPCAGAVLRQFSQRMFVVPKHGNVLALWHEARLDRYNRTLWRAARRVVDKFGDELQVRLVSAMRRAVATPGGAKPTKQQVQVKLKAWPMVGCPLAKSLLEFVTQRAQELGDLGSPCLGECPPHSLRPRTLRRVLNRLAAFEVVDAEADGKRKHLGSLGTVRLRWDAVAALAFKAVGTKPKAAASEPKAPLAASRPPGSAAAPAKASALAAAAKATAAVAKAKPGAGTPPAPAGGAVAAPATAVVPAPAPGAAPARGKPLKRKIDWSHGSYLMRIVRRGVRAADEEWRARWVKFCEGKKLSVELGTGSHAPEVLKEFIEPNMAMMYAKDWARDLLYRSEGSQVDAAAPAAKAGAKAPKAPGAGGASVAKGHAVAPASAAAGAVVPAKAAAASEGTSKAGAPAAAANGAPGHGAAPGKALAALAGGKASAKAPAAGGGVKPPGGGNDSAKAGVAACKAPATAAAGAKKPAGSGPAAKAAGAASTPKATAAPAKVGGIADHGGCVAKGPAVPGKAAEVVGNPAAPASAVAGAPKAAAPAETPAKADAAAARSNGKPAKVGSKAGAVAAKVAASRTLKRRKTSGSAGTGGAASRKRASSTGDGSDRDSYSSSPRRSRVKRLRRRREPEREKQKSSPGAHPLPAAAKNLKLTPELMMMNRMMGMTMMMGNPLALMGAQMMALPALQQAATAAAKAQAVAAGKPPLKQAKLDWNKQKDSMIDTDDL